MWHINLYDGPEHATVKMMKRQKPTRGRRLRVVIVDDSAYVRKSLMAVIERFRELKVVGEAADGNKAVEAVRKSKADVLILDIRMPRISGLEVLRRLKAEGVRCHTIVLSNERSEIYGQKCLELGAAEFFEKTGQVQEFFAALQRLNNCSQVGTVPTQERD